MKRDPGKTKGTHFFTTAQTDTEAGNENPDPKEEQRQALQALDALYSRGLIEESEYQKRRTEILEAAEEEQDDSSDED